MTKQPTRGADRVAFRISPELMERARAAVAAARRDPTEEDHIEELIEVILELTDRGLDFYYLEPLRRARAGTMALSATRLGLAAASRGIPPTVRRVITGFDEEQVLVIADFLDEILIRGGPAS